MNRFTALIALLIFSGCLASCHFHKLIKGKVAKIQTGADTNHIVKPMPAAISPLTDTSVTGIGKASDSLTLLRSLITKLTPIWKNRLSYNTFKAKAKVRIDGPIGKIVFTTQFRIRKDSAIWISADAMLGIYKVRILITRDSLSMINYTQKEVTRMLLTQAAKVLPAKVDFESLQNLLIGEPLRNGAITDASNLEGVWSVEIEDSSYVQHISYNKTDSNIFEGELLTHDPNGPKATYQYSAYDATGNRKIATSRVLEIRNGSDVYSLDLDFNKVEFDVPVDFPFFIPPNYSVKE